MLCADKDDERNKEEKREEGEWVDKEGESNFLFLFLCFFHLSLNQTLFKSYL